MSLFSPHKEPFSTSVNTKLFGYNLQVALSGTAIPLLYGQQRVPGNIIWTGDWQANPLNGSGKLFGKGGGSKGSNQQQFDYKTAIMVGLCQGPITGLGHIWVNKIQYNISGSSQVVTIPSGGGSVTPTNAPDFVADAGVSMVMSYSHTANDYGSPGPVTLTGQMLTPMKHVVGSPATGQYNVDPTTGIYTFSSADAGTTIQINYTWADNNSSYDGNPTTQLQFAVFLGTQGQSPWGYLTSNHPDQAIGYTELAFLANQLVDLGEAGVLQNYNFEVTGYLPFGGGITDANPAAIIPDFLSHPLHGAGFPSAAIGDLTQMSNYCVANGIFISPLLNQQSTAATTLEDWCKITNCAPVWSEGLLKFIPYGDTTVIGNGVIYTPNTTPIYDLDDDDFLAKEGEAPLKVSRPSVWDAYNSIKVEWTNRGNLYTTEPLEEKDDLSISKYGIREAPTLQLDAITSQQVAQQVANIALKNLVYKRNTYTFTVSAIKYCLLEPMDLITISDFYIGLDKTPVRITSIEEDETLQLKITAEEFPWGTATPTLNPKQNTGPFGPGYFSTPGAINPPFFFEATPEMSQNIQYELLIAISGTRNWGGCNVHVSSDGGSSYQNIGSQIGPTTMGYLTAPLASHIDPDTSDTLSVDITESLGMLNTFTQAQADKFVSLVMVDNELLSYATATMTGSYQFNANYLRRGVFNTPITAHPINAPFAVLDTSAFSWQYTKDMIGRTLFFKFTSFNTAGQQEEQISNVAAYPYFVHGPITPYPWAGSDTATPLAPKANEVFRTPSFGVDRQLVIDPNTGHTTTLLVVSSTGIVNSFSTLTQPPIISLTTSPTGGSIPGNQVLTVGIYARDNTGFCSRMTLASIEVPLGTNTNTITANVTFANPATDVGYVAISPDWEQGWFGPGPGTIAIDVGVTTYTFTTVASNIFQLNCPVPNPDFDHLVVQARTAYKFGTWGMQITAIASNGDGTCTITFPGCTWAVNQFAGRTLSCYGRANLNSSVPLVDVPIISNTATTVKIVDVSSILLVGDRICAWMKATTFTPFTIGDANIVNNAGGIVGGGGIPVNAYAGNLVLIVRGTGAGTAPVVIASNTATVLTTITAFEITPDATSEFLVINTSVEFEIATNVSLACADFATEWQQAVTLPGDWRHYFVQVLASDVNGDLSDPLFSPWRIFFDPDAPASTNPITSNPTGFSVSGETYAPNGSGQLTMSLEALWTNPTDPAILATYGGSCVVLKRPSFATNQIIVPLTLGTTALMPFTSYPTTTESWQFWLISANQNNVLNTSITSPAAGTPTTTISVSPPPPGPSGTEYTSNVLLGSVFVDGVATALGTVQQYITGNFTPPSDPTWGGVEARVYNGTTLVARNKSNVSPVVVDIPNPVGTVSYTIKFVSYNVNGISNTETGAPQVSLSVGSIGGSFSTGLLNAAIGDIINLNATNITSGVITSIAYKATNLSGSGVVTDITQIFDSLSGFYTGIQVRNNSVPNERISIGPAGFIIVNNSGQLTGEMIGSSTGAWNIQNPSNNFAFYGDTSVGLFGLQISGTNKVLLGATGVFSGDGYVAINIGGSQRYALVNSTVGKRITGASAQLASGTVTINTGLSTVDYAMAISTANETLHLSNSGSNVTFTSSNSASTAFISWFAVGNS